MVCDSKPGSVSDLYELQRMYGVESEFVKEGYAEAARAYASTLAEGPGKMDVQAIFIFSGHQGAMVGKTLEPLETVHPSPLGPLVNVATFVIRFDSTRHREEAWIAAEVAGLTQCLAAAPFGRNGAVRIERFLGHRMAVLMPESQMSLRKDKLYKILTYTLEDQPQLDSTGIPANKAAANYYKWAEEHFKAAWAGWGFNASAFWMGGMHAVEVTSGAEMAKQEAFVDWGDMEPHIIFVNEFDSKEEADAKDEALFKDNFDELCDVFKTNPFSDGGFTPLLKYKKVENVFATAVFGSQGLV